MVNRLDMEFHKGLAAGIVSCHEILKGSASTEEAQEKISDLLTQIRSRILAMVEDILS